MNIQLVKKNNVDQDMLSYEKNLRQHKLKTAGMVVAVIAIIGLCLYGTKSVWIIVHIPPAKWSAVLTEQIRLQQNTQSFSLM